MLLHRSPDLFLVFVSVSLHTVDFSPISGGYPYVTRLGNPFNAMYQVELLSLLQPMFPPKLFY